MTGPEDKADVQGRTNVASAGRAGATRETIDDLLKKAGWAVCDRDTANITAHRGVVIKYFPLKSAHGTTDYLFYIDGAPHVLGVGQSSGP